MKIALVVHPDRGDADAAADRVRRAAVGHGLEVLPGPDVAADAEVVIAVGGDGTVLEAVRQAWRLDIPVLGINVGHVGYLAAADPSQVEAAIEVLAEGAWKESTRMTIEASWEDGTAVGINDVVIEKVVSQRAVRIALEVDGRHFTTYRADGLVVATPTGSTAYAFSAGGPMVEPELDAIVVTPVAAHNLFAPTLVFSPAARLHFVSRDGRSMRVNIDGRQAAIIADGGDVEVRRGPRPARFIVPWARPFDQVVREKFRLDDD